MYSNVVTKKTKNTRVFVSPIEIDIIKIKLPWAILLSIIFSVVLTLSYPTASARYFAYLEMGSANPLNEQLKGTWSYVPWLQDPTNAEDL